jgi:hypothetical protein
MHVPMPETDALLVTAADHLEFAAGLAEPQDPDLAGQIRLAAATLPAEPDLRATPDGPAEVHEQLALAIACLDRIAPLAGPPDLQLSVWHLHQLLQVPTRAGAS